MRLHSLSYSEYRDQPYLWVLDELTLIDINFIVGKNAVGKSRILKIIAGISMLIKGELLPTLILSGHYKLVFKDEPRDPKIKTRGKQDIIFELEIHDKKVKKELLFVGDAIKLDRKDGGRTSIYFENIKDGIGGAIDIEIPVSSLAISARRDPKQHPYFEELHEWASTLWYFEFSNQPQATATVFEKGAKPDASNFAEYKNNIHVQFKFAKDKYGHDLTRAVVNDMRKVGYEIEEVGLMPLTGIATPINFSEVPQNLYVIESGIEKKLPQREISSGMYRALTTLIQLHIIRLGKKRGCLLIDDLGEGLDFDRAAKLILIVIAAAEKGFLQLILASNDRFVMNKVPLEYWSVIQRDKGMVKVFNPRNSPDAFSEFEEFGFNNFEFFSKGFYSTGIKDDKK
ncbi:MAG TPA: AAA family ATPase [Burkholderiaceae bacterium]|jgi:hypothetical protein